MENASTCGDNCAKWILEIGKIDVTINLRHMMSFGKDTNFDIEIQNGGEIVHSMRELLPLDNMKCPTFVATWIYLYTRV